MKINFKKQVLPHIVAFIGFVFLTVAYFSPALNNQVIEQHDIKMHKSNSREIKAVKDTTGEVPRWTNTLFSGMPTYLTSSPKDEIVFKTFHKIFHLGGWRPMSFVIAYLLGFYILLLVFRVNPWLSMAGAFAFGFSSYFFIIIAAGHATKAIAIGYMAPVIAGIYLAYKRKPFWGMILMTFFLTLQVFINHFQIVYYTMLIALIFVIFYLVDAIRKKYLIKFLKTSALLIAGSLIALSINAPLILPIQEYGKHSIRGASELTTDQHNRTTGLDKDYVVQWSYGKGETFTLLTPNFKGGASGGKLSKDSETYQVLKKYLGPQSANSIINRLPLYFGKQPFTSGPVYVGAFVFFLFIFGLFLVRGKVKWWLLTATILSIFLAWGKNFMWFSDIFLDYVPGYNKFRTVSMTLVIAELTMPLLGFLALKEVFDEATDKNRIMRSLKIATISVAGLLLIFIAAPGISNPKSPQDGQLVEQIFSPYKNQPKYQQMKEQMKREYIPALRSDRESLVRKDAFRSLIFVLLGAALIYLIYRKKVKPELAYALVFVIIIADMWPVNKRYLNDDNFISERKMDQPFTPSKADRMILKDKDPHYRVANLTSSFFQDGRTSYFHKSVGGYHGAKMRRYQELYDSVLNEEVQTARYYAQNALQNKQDPQYVQAVVNGNLESHVLDMLNAKYFIYNKKMPPVLNYTACGNAWFVKDYEIVENANEELSKIDDVDPHSGVLIDKRFEKYIQDFEPEYDSTGNIELTSYAPEVMKYRSSAKSDQLAVFSEIYYPHGWNVYVDGEKQDHFRVNYVLRAMIVPAGDHEIVFRFEPGVIKTGRTFSYAGTAVFFLLLLGGLFYEYRKRKQKAVKESDK